MPCTEHELHSGPDLHSLLRSEAHAREHSHIRIVHGLWLHSPERLLSRATYSQADLDGRSIRRAQM